MSERIDTSAFDKSFQKTKGLTWLPWVGASYADRREDQKLLIVGESHYVRPKSVERQLELSPDDN